MDRDDDVRSLHLTRLARTLAQRHGIEVRFASHGPVVQRDVLVLPDTLLGGDLDDDALFTDLLTHVGALGGEPWKVFVVILVGMNAGGFQQRLLEVLQAAHPTASDGF